MKNFKEIAEKCLADELSGRFVCRDGLQISSFTLRRTDNPLHPYKLYRVGELNENGHKSNKYSHNDIIQFIPYEEMKQEQIKIDIPEGKVPVMEQTEHGIAITWKEKELTYDGIINEIAGSPKYIIGFSHSAINDTNSSYPFYRKVNVLRKLTNIRNYFGNPTDGKGYGIFYHEYYKMFYADVLGPFSPVHVCFSTKEQAEQAIKMLGGELKYLFEPW